MNSSSVLQINQLCTFPIHWVAHLVSWGQGHLAILVEVPDADVRMVVLGSGCQLVPQCTVCKMPDGWQLGAGAWTGASQNQYLGSNTTIDHSPWQLTNSSSLAYLISSYWKFDCKAFMASNSHLITSISCFPLKHYMIDSSSSVTMVKANRLAHYIML
jgi:hypothetical protein